MATLGDEDEDGTFHEAAQGIVQDLAELGLPGAGADLGDAFGLASSPGGHGPGSDAGGVEVGAMGAPGYTPGFGAGIAGGAGLGGAAAAAEPAGTRAPASAHGGN